MEVQMLTDIVQTIAIIITTLLLIFTYMSQRKTIKAESFNRIGDLYDQIVIYRLEHPEVLSLGKKWKAGNLEKMYEDNNEAKFLAFYYSYCELCIGFCDICLYHKKNNLITETEYNDFHLGLLNLVAEENRELFREVAKKKYCSNTFKDWFNYWDEINPK